jgi:hypothetical protein
MCFQLVRLCKRLWTKSTTEWFLACMNSWMCFQSCRICKRHWTKSTPEWFLSCMNSWMYFQIEMSCKRLWTKITAEWFLSCMNPCMCSQIFRSCKRLWTKSTTKWFLSCMNPCMCSQISKLDKRLWTKRTTKLFFLLCMNSWVASELWWIFEGLFTRELSPDEEQKDLSHNEQLNGFSPVCLLKCSFRFLDRAKDFGQKEYNSRVFRQCEFSCVAAKYLDF